QLVGVVDLHVIVDNGSDNLEEIRQVVNSSPAGRSRLVLLPLGANFGIGRALNEGVRFSRQNAMSRWILTLDQDTILLDDSFPLLEAELDQVPNVAGVGIIAFNYSEHRLNQTRPYNRSAGPTLANSVITSGSIVNRRVFDSVSFDESLFLYFVDVDFCHQVQGHGFPIYILRNSFIDHREGSQAVRDGKTFYYLDPSRLYFVCRNGVRIFKRYHSPKALMVAGYLVAMNCLGATSRRESVRFAVRGLLASFGPNRFPPPFGAASR
ncbi:MAG: glycosyltransferase, partial [Thermoplasmata archaeon]